MQSVTDAFSVEATDSTRRISHGLQLAWKKDYRPGIVFFTIGVSTIGGNDIIAGPAGVQSDWNRYLYEDESDYALGYAYERQLSMPVGGMSKALAEVDLDNTSHSGGLSLELNGSTGFGQISTYTPTVTSTFSFAVWVKADALTANARVFDQSQGGPINGYALAVASGSRFSFGTYNAAGQTGSTLTAALSTGTWYHLVGTLNGATSRLYLNGALIATDTSSTATNPAGQTLTIGRRSAASTNFFDGQIDSLKFWDRELSDTEARDAYLGNTPTGAKVIVDFNGNGIDTSGNANDVTLTNGAYSTDISNLAEFGTRGRFTPDFLGGDSEIFTAVALPRRPMIINAGFEVGGSPYTIPQFVGLTTRPPALDMRRKTARLVGEDFIGFIQNSYVDKTEMFTYELSGAVIEDSLNQLGFSTAQYDVDTGLNVIKFGIFETGKDWGNFVREVAEAEGGQLYQDEEGVIRFEDRHHWAQFPHFNVQRVITTSQVINAKGPDYDHIINVVEVIAKPREVGDTELIWQTNEFAGAGVIIVEPGEQTEVWANFNDPVFRVTAPVPNNPSDPTQTSFYVGNSATDGSGSDATSSVFLKSISNFAQASKLVFENTSGSTVFITNIDLWGRVARRTGDIYYKGKRDASITAFEEHILKIENDYIQDADWAAGYAELILNDFAYPENLQELTIRAMPELQLGDLISWQGRYWRIYGIKTMIEPAVGFIQELKLLQRTDSLSYFSIGISVIGGEDVIAP